ncbi:hypothetical protein TNCV_727841 [Trichonephila clavipes]|nr:hypothetical protein TNCV_727841 [Trichonephila clavipes]
MGSLGHPSFPPTALGRQDDEEATLGSLRFFWMRKSRHACLDYVACKRSLEYQFDSGALGKTESRQYSAYDERA